MLAIQCLWNHVGSVMAICGTKLDATKKETNTVMFYSANGTVYSALYFVFEASLMSLEFLLLLFAQHLRSMKIPGREITALSWEGNSLRCAMTVDSYIYFANIRPDYMWCYFNKTVVFMNGIGGGISNGTGQPTTITFWDTTSNQVDMDYSELWLLEIGLRFELMAISIF